MAPHFNVPANNRSGTFDRSTDGQFSVGHVMTGAHGSHGKKRENGEKKHPDDLSEVAVSKFYHFYFKLKTKMKGLSKLQQLFCHLNKQSPDHLPVASTRKHIQCRGTVLLIIDY